MNLLIFLLLLASISTTSIAVLAKQTYIIHTDKTKFSGNSEQFYRTLLESVHQASFSNQETQPPQLLYVYQTAISGFSAELSPNHLETLRNVDGFISAVPDDLLTLHTTYSPHFLGLQNGKGLWNPTNLASDVIIGVLDTGIWPELISFHDSEGIQKEYILPARWKGDCEEGTRFSKTNCNKKLIGARVFYKGYESAAGRINETRDYRSPRDVQGHGTHTASTAAGNLVPDASLFGLAKGYASGVRYTTRIAAYKVCWALGCASSDILAAMDKAVSDGVDILSLSLGGSSRPYYSDSIAVASFGAIQNGVIVSCSAGNSGPVPSTVSNIAPWLITVAASYTDRTFPAIVQLGNGQSFEGASLYTGKPTKQLRLVYGKSAGIQGAEFCTSGTLKPNLVKGKIVLCQRGKNGRTQKGEIVKLAKGAGMILINTENEGEELFADPHILPAASLGAKAGKMVRSYLNSTKKPTAMISFKGTVFGNNAPMMAAFSSRGPSQVNPDVIKPDVTAPGVNILAAWPPTTSPSLLKTDNRSVLFNIISGTSMSCPHLSGVASLIKSIHKDWSPAAIKSALMTTAYTLDNKRATISDVASDTNSVATPFAFGSGHVDPESASDPGLIYDITTDDYLNYLCSLKYTPAQIGLFSRGRNFSCSAKTTASQAGDLNYPSFAVNFNGNAQNNVTLVYKRTVTNVGTPTSSYVVRVEEPNGVFVTVEPKILKFYKLGEKMSYTVSFVGPGRTSSDFSFGSLTWVSGKYTVRSPIAVTWQ